MPQTALRVAPEADAAPPPQEHAPRRFGERLASMMDSHFERVVLLILFVVFLTAVYGLGTMMKMGNTLDKMDTVITEISTTSQGNRVVSCTDLSLKAPAVAAALPQCAPTGQ